MFQRPLRTTSIVLSLLAAAAAAASLPAPARAEYPDRPITFISAYAPGATNDYLTRYVAKGVGDALHANEVVENRPGANGIMGTAYVARAAPDGYTLLTANSASHGINPTLYPQLPYDAMKDFQGVSMMASAPLAIVANAQLPANNIKELIAYGKAHPGKLTFATSGIGGTGHLTGEALILASKIDMVHVPYKGDALALNDTMGGQVPLSIVALSGATPLLPSGRLKLIAIASKERVPGFPDVQTLVEAGYPSLVFTQWFAIVAPSATPKPIIDKLNGAIKSVLESDAAKKSFATQGATPIYTSPEQTQAFMKAEIERFGVIIRTLDLKAP